MSDCKLSYFDARGRAELSRLVLVLAGKKFEDIRWSREDWPKYKKDAPFGQAPFLECKGQKYGQSIAIANFLARENGLYGKTNLDAFRIDEVMQITADLWAALVKASFEKDEKVKAELMTKNKDETFPNAFGFFNKMLAQNNPNGVFVGKELSLADLCAYDIMFTLSPMYDMCEAYPALKALRTKVETNPKIKTYLEKRKKTEF